ncbi:hypothetical protein BC831DRAFT_444544 [Entophlyctis helioformis]|nr:hypothetical protein BC831DRAFT_444544 [Entophlyctis helioformis]
MPAAASAAAPRRRVMGPTMPPPGVAMPTAGGMPYGSFGHADDADDDVLGPQPIALTAEQLEAREEVERLERLRAIEDRAVKTTSKGEAAVTAGPGGVIQREDWMTVPPEALRLDAGGLQMKSRQFNATTREKEVDTTVWTETPEERGKRILEGKDGKKDTVKRKKVLGDEDRLLTKEEQETAAFVASYNAAKRPQSLMQSFAQDYLLSGRFEDDDATKRGFDRDKDLVSRRVDAKARDKLLNEAKGLDSKFSSSRFL